MTTPAYRELLLRPWYTHTPLPNVFGFLTFAGHIGLVGRCSGTSNSNSAAVPGGLGLRGRGVPGTGEVTPAPLLTGVSHHSLAPPDLLLLALLVLSGDGVSFRLLAGDLLSFLFPGRQGELPPLLKPLHGDELAGILLPCDRQGLVSWFRETGRAALEVLLGVV